MLLKELSFKALLRVFFLLLVYSRSSCDGTHIYCFSFSHAQLFSKHLLLVLIFHSVKAALEVRSTWYLSGLVVVILKGPFVFILLGGIIMIFTAMGRHAWWWAETPGSAFWKILLSLSLCTGGKGNKLAVLVISADWPIRHSQIILKSE